MMAIHKDRTLELLTVLKSGHPSETATSRPYAYI